MIEHEIEKKVTLSAPNSHLDFRPLLNASEDNKDDKVVILEVGFVGGDGILASTQVILESKSLREVFQARNKYYTTKYLVHLTQIVINALSMGHNGLHKNTYPKEAEKLLGSTTIDNIYNYLSELLPKLKKCFYKEQASGK